MAKKFTGRTLSLFAAWILAMFFLLVRLIALGLDVATLALIMFYITLPMGLYLVLLGLAIKREKVQEIRELFDIDAAWAGLSILFGASITFALLLVLIASTRHLQPLGLEAILLQLMIIVPSEEFSFRFFLPRILPGHLIGAPGWVWAQGTFALLHYQAYGFDPFAIAFAFGFGILLFLVADGGKKLRLLGLGAAIGIHGVWNLFALSGASIGGWLAPLI